ncbi:hypothetical protein [Muricoccus pecuniae]|uniref:Uncharacterized protein n=1 Tax=Muricoccus pecuniae TaxID=693023 RepID=A0A840YGG0_9PROT|nr:hypothetical protein [Roseomonas pecuniae]MBB5693582.1 hypothetical protein [Roseomonas pecuniae]
MFDHDNSRNIFQAAMYQNAAIANQNAALAESNAEVAAYNARIAEGWEARAKRAEDIALSNKKIAEDALARVAALQAEAKTAKWDLLVQKATTAGFRAQLDAMKAAAPDCSAMVDSGKRYKDGDIKTIGRIAFEEAFDATLRAHNVQEPAKYRVD